MSQRSAVTPWRRRATPATSSAPPAPSDPPAVGGPPRAGAAAAPLAFARLLLGVGFLIALLIGLAILLRDVDANAGNTIVKGIHDGANFFAGSFTGLASFHGHPKRAITINWGIAAVAYLLAGAILAGLVARIGRDARARRRAQVATPAV